MLRGDISLMFQHSVSGFYILLFFKIRQIGVSKQMMNFISQILMISSRGQARYGKVKKSLGGTVFWNVFLRRHFLGIEIYDLNAIG